MTDDHPPAVEPLPAWLRILTAVTVLAWVASLALAALAVFT